ncbi:MAG: hypothetical protein F4Y16_15475 [Holophagales bacterium]|nr:hypothetical protein [Holophagales bacterium]MYH26785.1 hypothetical protein [Holophagales bacterium]
MKNYLMFALILCAIPAVAVGQTVSCDACTHAVSVYMGEGGLIAMTDADEVTYVATCNGVTRSGEMMPNDDGMVSMLLMGDMACHGDDDASFELGPVMDGGWYWLTMETNSAVGGLVSMDILDNDMVEIADAGAGVMMTMGSGAVLLTESATGRVGILPTILPEPPAAPAAVCGPEQNSSWPYAWDDQVTSSCMLGGGRTKIRLVGPGAHGSTAMITNGMVYRPNAGTVTVTADLWVDESGSYSTNTGGTDGAPTVESIQMGWAGKTASATGSGSQTNWLDATFIASVNATVGAPVTITSGTPVAGIDVADNGSGTTPSGQASFTIVPDANYCSSRANHTAVLNIIAVPGTNAIHPPVAQGRAAGFTSSSLATVTQITQLRVVCPPASSANKGQDLVPDNPFPVE